MTDKLPSKAKFWGIGPDEAIVLLVITYWFNGRTLTIRGEDRQIGTHHDLPLEDMFRGSKFDYSDYEAAHEWLIANDFLQEQYICRRKIDWSPTEQGIQAIRECLEPWDDNVRPEWADETASGPLYGDPNEGLVHRKGVEVAANELPKNAWTYDHRGRYYGMSYYPEDDRGEACHDFHVQTADHLQDIGVDVITSNNNDDYFVQKWERFAEEDRLTFWLFDGRETACGMFNELDKQGRLYLDGGQFNTPANWSAKAINRKLWRSESNYRRTEISDVVHTVTGVLEGDDETLHNLFNDYYSNTS